MRRFRSAFCVAVVLFAPLNVATADDKEVAAILSKASKALGGDEKLSKIQGVTWKTTGWINMAYQLPEHFKCKTELTIAGLDRSRFELTISQSGDGEGTLKSVLNGDNAWLDSGEGFKPTQRTPGLKRSLYFAMIPVTLAPLKDPRFKIEAGGEARVGDRPAVVLNVTCPDGEIIKVSFDKESGLPLKAVGKALLWDDGAMDLDMPLEMSYSNYKDFAGTKTAAQIDIKSVKSSFFLFNRRLEVIEFKPLKSVDPSLFATK